MTRFIYDCAATLTGHIADREDSLDWLFAVPGGDEPGESLVPSNAAVLVEGSTTYEWCLRHGEDDFTGAKPTFVFTSRQLPVRDGADVRFRAGSVAEHLPAIRSAAGDGDVWIVGGGDLAGQFLDAGVLDRIAVTVAPVLLEGGAPLLPRTLGADRLTLVSAAPAGHFARLVYDVVPAPPAG